MTIEPFEQRVLLAIDGPVLLAVIPSTGIVVEQGTVLDETPRQLLFRFDSAIDARSLVTNNVPTAIQFKRGGNHVLGDGNDVTVTPGFIGIGENSIDVIVRFDQNLPDDLYQLTVVGAGSNPLRDTAGLPFNAGENLDRTFSLDLGAQVVAVVPQPITRDTTTHKLNQPATNKIEVYFNANDPLDQNSAQNVSFYQLIRTGGTATTQDDNLPNHQPINPILVEYSQSTGKAILTFANGVLEMPGTYRLRIGTSEPLALPPTVLSPGAAGTDFAHAASLGPGGNPFPADLGTQTIEVHDGITSVPTPVLFPGSPLEPGERDTDIEAHVFGGSNNGNIPVFSYNFKAEYGTVLGQPVFNLITPTQKERIREVLSYFSQYVGVEFVETSDAGFIIVTGDVRAVNPNAPPTGIGGIAGGGVAIMNALIDWGASEQGGSYFKTAMHEIGHLLGLGHNYEAPPLTIMGSGAESALGSTSGGEPVFPGDLDILYGRYVWPALGNDINVYRFNLSDAGRINIETFAERLRSLNLAAAPSQLDSVISIYDSTGALIARNDDYYGKDSFVQLQLTAGTYYVAITSTGNTNFDPRVVNSGFGGTTQGDYQLRITFTPTPGANDGIRDQTGTRLDGDRDGLEGGVSNFWFKVNLAQTLYVDKASTGGTGALGTYTNPYTTISQALAAATTGYIVRIVGNPGADNVPATLTDNLSYNVGFNSLGQALSDGSTFNVPRGVTVMIDAGAIIKLRAANIDVGSSAQGIERGAGALQVLGTPAKDASGRDIGSVFFTSYYNNTIGFDTGTAKGPLTKGNWGGLVFRNDSDLESAGIFLNYVNRANLSWGGGQVSVNSVLAVYDPIHLETSRPTITYNVITSSADSAISADPNSFEETEFLGADYHAEYSRVGPRVYGNTLTQNSINGLFIRVRTLNGRPLDPLTLNARLANTDIVHVLNEVLLINGEAGGFIRDVNTGLHARPSARLAIDPGLVLKMGGARIETEFGAQFIAEGTIDRPVIFTSMFDDRFGASGTSDTTNDLGGTTPVKGNWSGMFFGPLSVGSIDHALVAFAGGTSSIEGGFGEFDPVEIIQAQVRIANSTFDRNQLTGGGERNGRGPSDGAAIFIRGAQPVILNNVFKNNFGNPDDGVFVPNDTENANLVNTGAVISINVNALNSVLVDDWGRSRGRVDFQGSFGKNSGPLIRNNLVGNNSVNGMIVRGGTITTNVVWDDTDIVHVVMSTIQVPNQQSLSGTMRLESSAAESLVVKLLGTNTDLIGSGEALDMTDRTGGTLQLVGTPNHPVVVTSLKDDSVGAGLTPEGRPQTDTLNRKGVVAPAPPNLANQGPIILYSAPLDEHGVFLSPPGDNFDGWDTLESLVRYVRGASTVQEPLADVLAVGLHDLPTLGRTYSQVAIENVTQQLGLSLAWVDTGSEIGNVDFNDYGMVYIPSDAQTPLPTPLVQAFQDILLFGGIADFQLDALADRKGGLVDYVNQGGGGLLALSQNTAAEPYKWLDVPDRLIINKSGGNVLTQTAQAPPEWLRTDDGFTLGLPWLYAFEGTAGFNRLEPWLVDPVTGEIAMLGLAPGGPGLGPPRDIATPGDWGSVRLDVLSNDRNVDVINEIEQGFTASGDANQLPSTAQFLGEMAKDQVSGDDNVRLAFEIHGGLSQAANSPGGADVDVYSFRGTAGTRVWIDIDRTASSLDSVVELVDANGAVIAGSDNSIAESSGTQATVGIARPMESGAIPGLPSPFATRDFYTSNPKDAGLRANLPGTPGTVNTYFVRVRSASTNLSNLTGGVTKGAYVLQVRLQEKDEFAGSTVRYADIRFATSGIEVIGKPERSPLMSYSAELARGKSALFDTDLISTFATAQNLGNLLTSDRRAINVAGNLRNSAEVDWYKFELNYEQVQKIGGLSDFLTTFAGMIRINYADGLVRPDTTLSLFDDQGRLLMVGRDSQLVDALPRPNAGGDNANQGHGSYGQLDPTIGPVHIPAGTPITVDQFGNRAGVVTYYVAVSSAAQLPQALAGSYTNLPFNPFVRLEPSDGIDRISEDHFGTDNFSTANPPQQLFPALPGDDINILNTHADTFQLGDVVLFVDTWFRTEPDTGDSFLRMVNPFTGTVMNTANNAPLLELPTSDQPLGFFNIAMRNDGRLFALTQGDSDRSSGNYVEVNTASGDIVNAANSNTPLDDMLDTYRLGPGTDVTAIPPVIEWNASNRGVQWQALAYLQGDSTTSRRLFAIGNRAADDQGAGGNATVPQRTNLLFELNPDTGEVLDRPPPPQAVYSETLPLGSGTDAVPIGNFSSITDTVTGMAIIGDDMYFITNRGDFYLVENWAGPTASNNPYHLGLRGDIFGGLSAESEINNSIATADDARTSFRPEGANGSNYHLAIQGGNISSTTDLADTYEIGALHVGDTITITMSGADSLRGSHMDPYLELYREGVPTPVRFNDDAGATTDDAYITFTVNQASEEGAYFVRARSATPTPPNPQEIGSYALSVFLENSGAVPDTSGPIPTETAATNDTVADAQDVSDGWRQANHSSRVTGTIAAGDPADFFHYEFNDGDLISVVIESGGLNAQVELYDAAGMLVATENGANPGPDSSVYSFIIPSDGPVPDPDDYFVAVRSATPPSTGGYAAVVYLTTDVDPPMPPADVDFFDIGELQEGDTITITMSGADSNRSGVNVLDDPVVELHRSGSAAPVALDPTGDSGPGSDSLIYRYTVPAGIPVDTYFIRAAGQNNALGSYQLGVWLDNAGAAPRTGGSVTTETEPNNLKVGTQSFAATSWRQTQYLSQTTGQIAAGDRDFFEYTFTPGDLVTINIDADPNSTLEAQVKLYDSNGNMVIASEDGTSRPGDSSIYAFIIPQGPGQYFVEVSAESGTGNYNAQVYLSTPNAAGILGNSLPAETETNNTFATADNASTNFSDLAATNVRATRMSRVQPTAGTTMTGLARGPLHVEAGAYANTLFAIDTDGRLFAIDRSGNPAPIFTDGRTSISTGITNAQGLAFSSLDYNLWHVTVTRATDTGHGIVESFDNNITRDPGGGMPFQYLIGGASFYFGLEPVPPPNPVVRIDAQPGARPYDTNPNLFSTYQLPGGALGSLTSNTFSLEGYTSGDQPALYFNYLLETSDVNSTSNTALDAMRVLVSPDGVNWELLATNNVVLGNSGAENPVVLSPTGGLYNGLTAKQKVQGLFEPDQQAPTESLWRQARVDLADFAGKSNLRLRFQFSTAGTMGSGSSTSGTGRVLQALPGSDLRDGQTFRIDSTTFTFRSGFALNVAAGGGALIADGETITINGTPFEFKKMGVPTATQILITDDLSAEEVAQRIASVLSQPQFSLVVRRFGSRIEVSNALTMSSTSPAVIVQGAPVPAAPAATDIVINGDMSSTQVAVAIATALDRVFTVGTNDGLIFTTSKLSGDQLRIFGHTITSSGPLPSFSGTLPGDSYGRFNDPSRNRHRGPDDILDPALEGVYIDDIIIGFASRGEIVTNAVPGDIGFTALPLIPGAPTRILAGDYQLQMGPSDSYAFPLLDSSGHIALTTSFDVNDRFARGFTLVAPPASQIVDGQTFTIDDGYNPLVFEFDMNGSLTNSNHVRVTVANGATEASVAVAIRDAINLAAVNRSFKVRASTATNGNRVDLFDALQVKGNALVAEGGSMGRLLFGAPGAVTHTGQGDVNGIFGQFEVGNAAGQTLILGNQVSDSRQVGIQVVPKIGQIIDPKAWFTVLGVFPVGFPEVAGSAANLAVLNSRQWIPGVTLKNNLVVESGRTAIQVGGSPNATFSYAQNGAETEIVWDPVLGFVDELEVSLRDVPHYQPFVRVVNNTVYGAKNGIAAVNASTPTIINNIIANTGVALTALIRIRAAAINVDISSAGGKGDTVIGANLYQNNVFNALGTGDSNAILLFPGDPLFVDAANRNFYLAEDSLAIDSSVNSVQERTALLSATLPLGMPPSPIQAPETDLLGQLRVDDPFVPTPPGLGSNVFKDRGAVERADFVGPTAALVNPIDNDPNRIDRNPLPNHLQLVNAQLTDFSIQLLDGVGAGIDDSTVLPTASAEKFTIQRTIGGTTTTLTRNVDYVLVYDTNSKIVKLIPSQGIWLNATYTITLDNSMANGIRDLADNLLQPNEPPNTQFVIELTDQIVSPWQNPDNKYDVSGNGLVSGFDLLLIVNRLLTGQIGVLPEVAVVPPYLDISGDGRLTAIDALQLINFILSTGTPRSESAPPVTTTTLDADLPSAVPAAAASNSSSVAVGLAMSQEGNRVEAEDEPWWAPLDGSPDAVTAQSVATATLPMEKARQAGALAATMEPDEFDTLNSELDSILTELAGDLRRRVLV